MFDAGVFWPAFQQAGLLVQVTRTAPPASQFLAGFVQPDALVLGEAVHTAFIQIEYQSADLAAEPLARGEDLVIDGQTYRVRGTTMQQGDGTFTKAELERVPQ